MKIAGRTIGKDQRPYIIAELSCNHCGEKNLALELIHAAKETGADCAKIQAYTPDTITIDCDNPDFRIKEGLWKGKRLYELYSSSFTPFEWLPDLFDYAKKLGIPLISSVFDGSSIRLLEAIGCPAYKIASMEIVDLPLIRLAAKTCKPLILSTGMASDDEISDAINAGAHTARHPAGDLAILHCVSGYPTPIYDANLLKLKEIQRYLNCVHGISDHSLGWEIPVAATIMGANIIEKHLMLPRAKRTEDRAFSLIPKDFQRMVGAVRDIWTAMHNTISVSEEPSRQLRRSLYVVKDMKKGDKFTHNNVRSIRPGYGLYPDAISKVIGRKAAYAIERGSALQMEMLDE